MTLTLFDIDIVTEKSIVCNIVTKKQLLAITFHYSYANLFEHKSRRIFIFVVGSEHLNENHFWTWLFALMLRQVGSPKAGS